MERYHRLLLDVWREACRHIEINESTATITAALADHVPLERMIVRRLDLQHSCLETVAVGTTENRKITIPGRSTLDAQQLQQLAAWASRKQVIRESATDSRQLFPLIAPVKPKRDCLAGPLTSGDEPTGVLIMVARSGTTFQPQHAKLLDALLEPFSVALENDQRLHEMATLREAAEADRRALLTRLGRRELTSAIVGADAGLRHVMERVDVVARSDVPVLLLGQTGTGKEVVARAIHDRSSRHDAPFIRVNCGAIPSELIDSQLFGHERGSFSGAVETHKGWFERADGGTLFLDEIGELLPAAQVRLLRVLQDGYVERVGGERSLHVDVRVVAATHRDLTALLPAGRFREDLWYRIAVFPIPIPPLRDRPEDIPALACHFADRAATRFGLPLVMPTPEDIRMLLGYAWPGNVRELAAVIDRAALLGNGRCLEVAKALGLTPTPPTAAPTAEPGEVAATPRAPNAEIPAQDASLDDITRRHIETVLQATHGRIEGPFGAARRLAINPHTLRARMRRLGIDWRRFRPPTAP